MDKNGNNANIGLLGENKKNPVKNVTPSRNKSGASHNL